MRQSSGNVGDLAKLGLGVEDACQAEHAGTGTGWAASAGAVDGTAVHAEVSKVEWDSLRDMATKWAGLLSGAQTAA